MRRVWLLLLLVCTPATAHATWAYLSVEESVRESDLVVVGTLRDVREWTAGGEDYGEGRIDVREVIWGEAAPGAPLLLRWSNASANVCPRVEHRYDAGAEGIWLLTREGDAVRADHPGRFVAPSKRAEVEAALRDSPVVLRADKYLLKLGEPMRFRVVYRNASDAPRTFPGLAFQGGNLRVSPGSRLALTVTAEGARTRGAARLAARVVQDEGLSHVTVPPRAEQLVEFDLRELLATEPVDKSYYNVTFRFAGLPPTNEINFYVNDSLSRRPAATPPPPPPAPRVDYSRHFVAAPVARRELTPRARAGLTALAALLLFPFFYRLRSTLAGARLARVLKGTQTWQI